MQVIGRIIILYYLLLRRKKLEAEIEKFGLDRMQEAVKELKRYLTQ